MPSDRNIDRVADFSHFVDVLGCSEKNKWCPEEDSILSPFLYNANSLNRLLRTGTRIDTLQAHAAKI